MFVEPVRVSTKKTPAPTNAMSWSPLLNRSAGRLQRKCACGGTPGLSGECAACRAKRVAKEATAGGSSRAATAPGQGRGHDFAAVGVERKDGVVHGPAGTANHWDDCPPTWRPKANAAQALGANWVDNVVNGLSSVLALPPPIPKPVENLLLKHFHTSANKDVATINGRYKKIQTAIHSSLNFECETSCDANVLAYVYSVWTDLHLCPYWFNSASDLQGATVIHEIAHDVVGADDNAYEWQTAKYAGMSVSDAMNNADSFGHFAWDASKPPPPPPPTPPPPTPPPGPTPKGP
jgi:hypothetical protein